MPRCHCVFPAPVAWTDENSACALMHESKFREISKIRPQINFRENSFALSALAT